MSTTWSLAILCGKYIWYVDHFNKIHVLKKQKIVFDRNPWSSLLHRGVCKSSHGQLIAKLCKPAGIMFMCELQSMAKGEASLIQANQELTSYLSRVGRLMSNSKIKPSLFRKLRKSKLINTLYTNIVQCDFAGWRWHHNLVKKHDRSVAVTCPSVFPDFLKYILVVSSSSPLMLQPVENPSNLAGGGVWETMERILKN